MQTLHRECYHIVFSLTKQEIQRLADNDPQLQLIEITHYNEEKPINVEEMAKALETNKFLKSLVLIDCGLDDDDAKVIRSFINHNIVGISLCSDNKQGSGNPHFESE